MAKLGPNDPCDCGSGRKVKKCCGGAPSVGCTSDDRARALTRLDVFRSLLGDEEDGAIAEFWAGVGGSIEELGPNWVEQSDAMFDGWLLFDRPFADGRRLVDRVLERPLPPGERRYLEGMRASTVRLYEIVDVRPGRSITLHDLLEGTRVTVNERSFSRQATVRDWIGVRVNPLGPSGGPELELGALMIAGIQRDGFRQELERRRRAFAGDAAAFFKQLAPVIHAHWARSILDPVLPTLTNTDGERMTMTRVEFDVADAPALRTALASLPGLEAEESDQWRWAGKSASQDLVTLGTFKIAGGLLLLETNSAERGARARKLVERSAGAAVRYRATSHEDLARIAKEHLKKKLRGDQGEEEEPPRSSIPPEVQEELVLDHLGRHYRAWVDLPVPALDDATPRAVAKDGKLRPRLVSMLHELEGQYSRQLKAGEPAYDPSWMWAELGLASEEDAESPPLLAHERVGELVDGATLACRGLAARLRHNPGFDEAATLDHQTARASDIDIQRIVRKHPSLAPMLRAMVDFDLHRRKTFWVSGDLTWTLSHTELDLPAELVRVPFPTFALVFTDRHVLSLAERLLAVGPPSPVAGHILKVVTIYVTEAVPGLLDVVVAADALGADPPAIREIELRFAPGETVEEAVEHASSAQPGSRPLSALLGVVLQAILYATSVGVEPVVRPPASAGTKTPRATVPSSESVYYLPGTIDISRLRSLRELERTVEGRQLLHRFLVRGHWRRPPESWKDQRMRWIAPHWKGPPAAVAIERAYRLEP